MGDIYTVMLIALTILAVIDLVVGVSNDAVNFLNSAIGSKAVSVKSLMIIASLGIFFGAIFSSGMMEVARKGIFVPGEFYFDEIMIIFLAVMLTDVLLLDLFNSLGMPTSTTVSIVFELLGAAVVMALIKINASDSQTFTDLGRYINSESALKIIIGILLSVVFAFTIGAIVQFISRLIFSFEYENKHKYVRIVFGSVALTAITYFIFMKGLKGTPFYQDIEGVLAGNEMYIIFISFVLWSLISFFYSAISKKNNLILVVIIGTFGLALAFAGNDLVNFIGVPMAAFNSYDAWFKSGIAASEFSMGVLSQKVRVQPLMLFIAGAIMVVTLWFSKKARSVTETEIGLSRQGEGHEKFKSNFLSRSIVRGTLKMSGAFSFVFPKSLGKKINHQFEKPVIHLTKDQLKNQPAFDLVRASANLMVAGILISIATSFKLPLSTTYVTFMVAMGTSLADRAWDRESAVYRVAGVINVIGGWFSTAILAFVVSGTFAFLIHIGGSLAVIGLFALVAFLLLRSYFNYSKKVKEQNQIKKIKSEEKSTINDVIVESSIHISEVVKKVNELYASTIKNLIKQDLKKLSKIENKGKNLNEEVNTLKSDVFYFIKSLDDNMMKASKFYLLVVDHLQDIVQSIEFIGSTSFNHVNNNHKNLKKSQIKNLNTINNILTELLTQIESDFRSRNFDNLIQIIDDKQRLVDRVSQSIEEQIERIRTDETSQKNATLYFGLLLETKDLIQSLINLLQLYQEFQITKER
ncbi:Phosphate transporter family protein [Lutibacter agarilyticus]|uniref:Phosphate transporter n=1 Tax=Lutibacter agarilyticus TaxID=1109740 RepID=A0A238W6Y9_9FLAO|nr:inorganic phosphate transporter [Lutibacter agarilyticus]SNR41469.1 Phosphate transporter family protein [Lutibacter agarilyticus]